MTLYEGQINKADAKELFKTAANLRNRPTGMRKIPGFRKDRVDVYDLRDAWADEGYPDDTRDIAAILRKQGFNPKEINKVFKGVFGDSAEKSGDASSPIIQKVADFAKKNDLVEDLIDFMAEEYKFTESYAHEGKAVVEDIRQIFDSIVQEERRGRAALIKKEDKAQLGRTKK